MQRLKGLDELTPADLWREVPRDDDEFWPDVRERQQRLAKTLIEGALEEEMTLLLGAGRYRRVEVRHGYRNGFYERDLATQIGIVTAIRVPRARDQAARRPVFRRYQRRQAQVNDVIRDVFLAGVSTRRVGEALEALVGERVSAQTVSRVARSLDREVARFQQAAIPDDVLYLLLDGVYLRVKSAAATQRKLVLCAYAITASGERRLLDFRLGTAESQAQWEAFLSQLRERGLLGKRLRLIVTDGCKGPPRAGDGLPVRTAPVLLGSQASQRCKPSETDTARVPGRGEGGLQGWDEDRCRSNVLGLGQALARGGAGSSLLPGAGHRQPAELPRLSTRAPTDGAHDQCHRALLPGSPQADSSNDLLQQQRQL